VNVDTRDVLYNIDRFSLLANIEKVITNRLKSNLSYEYSFVDTKDVDPDVILTKEDVGTLGIGSVSTSLFYDRRDNPFNPESGSINGIVFKWASKAFLSETDFLKVTVQSSWFFKLRKRIVFACSLKGGTAYAFEGTKELPLVERFFLGGRTTVRGYSHDTLGPKGEDGSPTGGNAFALLNAELRFDVGKGFGLVTFVDGGNVWQLVEDVDGDLEYAAGAGLRYNTPVGPLRLDYGYKLKKEEGLSSGEVHFSFGHAF
jgi:outer membrane protein insertion porin family